MTESGAGCPLSMIESDGIAVDGDGVPQARKAKPTTMTAKNKFFIIDFFP